MLYLMSVLNPNVHLSVRLSVCLSVLSVCLSIHPSICLCLSIHLSLFVQLSVCPSICLSICLCHPLIAVSVSFRSGPSPTADSQSQHDTDNDTGEHRWHSDGKTRRLRHGWPHGPLHLPAAPAYDNNDYHEYIIDRPPTHTTADTDDHSGDVDVRRRRPSRSTDAPVDLCSVWRVTTHH